MDDEIANSSLAVESLHAFTSKSDHRSMLGSCLDLDFFFAQYREIECPSDTECSLCWSDMDSIVEIGPITSESALFGRYGE